MLTDWYAWRVHEKPNETEFEDDDFDADAILADMENDAGAWEDMSKPALET
jgi:hypothetical protein